MKTEKGEAGFSLLELVVGLGVLTVILGAAMSLLNNFQMAYKADEAAAEAERNGRFAISRLEEIIRSAGTNPTQSTTVNNTVFVTFPNGAGSSSVRLKSDLDGDGQFLSTVSSNSDVIVVSEDVTLQLSSNSLQMVDNTVAGGSNTTTIANDIRSLTFDDPSGTGRSVTVNLIAMPSNLRPGDPRYMEVNFVSTIRLRNR